MSLRAVLLDAEGTLVHIHPSVGQVYARVLAEEGLKLDPDLLDARIREIWPRYRGLFRKGISPQGCRRLWARIFEEVMAPWLNGEPRKPLFEKIYRAFAQPENFRLASGAREALQYLRERSLTVAVLSNWDERLPQLLSSLGLRDYFACIFVACETGVGKPHPQAFHRACKVLGVAPGETLMVGNDPEDDYLGALRAGLRARLYRGENLLELLCEEVEGGRCG